MATLPATTQIYGSTNSGSTGSLATYSYQVWTAWNNQHYTATSHTTATANTTIDTWTAWNVTHYTTGSLTNATTVTFRHDGVWGQWIVQQDALNELKVQARDIQRYSRRKLSDDELRRELEREKTLREEAEKRARAAEAAKQRAEQLLLGNLTAKQKEDLKSKNSFYVDIPIGDGKFEHYRIDRGTHGNVYQLDEKGSIIRRFCVQPEGVPAADAMLAQKLFICASEETRNELWSKANITEYRPDKRIPATVPREFRRQYALEHNLLN